MNKKDKKKIRNKKGIFSFLKWRNIRIGQKYIASFLVTAILFFAAGTIVYLQLTQAGKDIEQFDSDSQRTYEMMEMASLSQLKDVQMADYVITRNQKYADEYIRLQEEFNILAENIEAYLHTEEQLSLFAQVKANDRQMDNLFNEVLDIPKNQEYLAGLTREHSNRIRISTVEGINSLIDSVLERQTISVDNANKSIDNSTFILAFSNALAILLGVLIMVLISLTITRNLNKVVHITKEVANGNLAIESLDYLGRDEIGQLATAINQMKDNIHTILVKVAEASLSVSTSSEELTQTTFEVKESGEQIASTMVDLSTGAEIQANSAADLSEKMIDFVRSIRISEQEGQEVATTSTSVINLTTEGAALMRASVEQMKQIDGIVSEAVGQVKDLDKQSNEITQLVSVIKNIADQTNLLALNAAIEAARAGEHGRGFAVVADEVRKLAEQVSTSVSEITGIVTNIQAETNHVVVSLNKGYDEVKAGTEQIERTGKNFEVIDTTVSDMVKKILSISSNLKEIAENSNQMEHLIQDISSVSEESAAGVEEAAATVEETASSMDEVSYSADELAKLAEQLNDEISVFRLK